MIYTRAPAVRQHLYLRGRTFDQNGNALGGLGADDSQSSFGANVFELFNPGTVQAEYDAEGKAVPSKASIISDAVANIGGNVSDAEKNLGDALSTFGKWFVVALVAGAVLAAVHYAHGTRHEPAAK